MKLKVLITTLALGLSSAAVAAPGTSSGPTVRDHRTKIDTRRPIVAPPPVAPVYRPPVRPVQPRPVMLANNTKINGRTAIRVNQPRRTFSKLELRSQTGRTSINKVVIQFANGRSQQVALRRTLAGKQSLAIDIAGNARSIKNIVLVGRSGPRAAVDVVAI